MNPLKKKLTEATPIHLVIDADSLCFRAAHVANKEEAKQEPKGNKFGFEEEHMNQEKQDPCAVYDDMLADIIQYCEVNMALEGYKVTGWTTYFTASDRYAICDGLPRNFRKDLWEGYKDCRKGMPLPEDLELVFEYAVLQDCAILCAGKEADDVVAYEKRNNPEGVLMVALDKDLLFGVPGRHVNFNTWKIVRTSPEDALRYAYIQSLEGDSSDCYKGAKGIGKVGARKIIHEGLTTEEELWAELVKAYLGAGMTKEDALLTMRLARMDQWDGEKIALWNPPISEN